jgi:hypothetical protein
MIVMDVDIYRGCDALIDGWMDAYIYPITGINHNNTTYIDGGCYIPLFNR